MKTSAVTASESSLLWKTRSLRLFGAGVATSIVSTMFIQRGMSCRSEMQHNSPFLQLWSIRHSSHVETTCSLPCIVTINASKQSQSLKVCRSDLCSQQISIVSKQFLLCKQTVIPKAACRWAVQQYNDGNLTLQTTLAWAEQLTISPALQLVVWRALQQAVGSKCRHTAAIKPEEVQIIHALGGLHQSLVILHTIALLQSAHATYRQVCPLLMSAWTFRTASSKLAVVILHTTALLQSANATYRQVCPSPNVSLNT